MATLELRNLRKQYGDTVIVPDLSLKVEDGELLVLVGPSGCGKSTLIRMVAGLLEPTSGAILIDGEDVSHKAPGARDVAMVFQSYALYPHMTVFNNIAFPLRVRKTPAEQLKQQVLRVAEQLGLEDLLQRLPGELSGGQRQRVAMGRAIIREPRVFLFDEPLSNLDAALRTRMRAEVAALHKRLKTTTLYVTHDQREAMTLGSRLVLLNQGRIEQLGAPLEVYAKPASHFVASFLGNPPMAFVPVERRDAQLRGPGFALPLAFFSQAEAIPETLWLGLRPEDLSVTQAGDGNAAPQLPAKVSWIERTGSDGFVYAQIDDATLVARIPSAQAAAIDVGSDIAFAIRAGTLFDRASGRAVA